MRDSELFERDGNSAAFLTGNQDFSATDAGVSPLAFLNADDRGGLSYATNNKQSLTVTDAAIQLTRSGLSWATGLGQAATVTFAFRGVAPTTMPSDTANFTPFTQLQISQTLLALQAWSDVANINFQRVDDGNGYSSNATMLFGNYTSGQSGAAAFAYQPGNRSVSSATGDVWINSSLTANQSPGLLNYGQHTLVHEIGHAIGLSHPAAYNASEGVSITYGANAVYYEDSRQYTVMSYFSQTNTGADFGAARYASAPLLDDIAAAQRLYGANMSTRTGDTVYGFNSNAEREWFIATSSATALIFAVWDAGGIDTFDFSGYTQNQIIDLRQGAFSNVGGLTGNVAIALGAVIERAVGGSGNDTIHGNAGDNVITGGAGNDTIDGGLGSDTAVFSGALSAYTITYSGQYVTITGADGADRLINVEFARFSDQTLTLAAPTGPLTLSGDITNNVINGGSSNDTLLGYGGDDTLNGNDGDDTLNGGSGADTLNGGNGNDTLTGGAGNDVLNGGAGVDRAIFVGSNGVGVTVNLALGTASGGDGSDTLSGIENITGTAYDDVITGDAGDNQISGNGGVDTIYGGAGNDVLYAGVPGLAGGAPDIVKSASTTNNSIGAALSVDDGFDLLPRTDVASSGSIPHATVVATSHGGIEYYAFTVGADTTVTFDIDNAAFDSTLRILSADGTQLAENDDGGSDSADTDSQLTFTFTTAGTYYVQVARWLANSGSTFTTQAPTAGSTYTLHISIPNHSVQPITQVGSTLYGEDGDDDLAGGVGSDTLYGGDGNDTLSGILGGNDVMNGGAGDDRIAVHSQQNQTVDGGTGIDTVVVGATSQQASYTTANGVTTLRLNLGAGVTSAVHTLTNVERIQFTDQTITLNPNGSATGTEGPDTLLGTAGADTLNGLGGDDTITPGLGSDLIDGGAGTDTLVLPNDVSAYYFEQTATGWRIHDGATDIDTVTNVEFVKFANNPTISIAAAAAASFDAYRYMAAYADLANAFRASPGDAYRHFVTTGRYEGRSPTTFNTDWYLASNPDLISALGGDGRSAARHYVLSGREEGRPTTSFNGLLYAASNVDLARIIGDDAQAAIRHYVQYGSAEGRPTSTFNALVYGASNPQLAAALGDNATALLNHYLRYGADEGRPATGFDPLLYGASNPQLAAVLGDDADALLHHYLRYGVNEGRPTTGFNPLLYGASNPQLAAVIGDNADALLHHYLRYGVNEGRPTSGFDALAYAASSPDLARVLGTDVTAALHHYLAYGVNEGRPTSGFDAVGYLLTYGDLGGMTPTDARSHWLNWGADEGRVGDAMFGREQGSHSLTGGSATGSIESGADHDWFSVSLQAGQMATINVAAAGAGSGTLGDAYLRIYDSLGRLVAADNDSGPGLDAQLTFAAATSGTYYLVISSNNNGVGSYRVASTSGSASQPELLAKSDAPATLPHETLVLIEDDFLPTILTLPTPENSLASRPTTIEPDFDHHWSVAKSVAQDLPQWQGEFEHWNATTPDDGAFSPDNAAVSHSHRDGWLFH